MIYVPVKYSDNGVAKVVYTAKDKNSRKVFNALDWLARLVTHIRNHDPPAKQQAYIPELFYDYSDSQIPVVDYWN